MIDALLETQGRCIGCFLHDCDGIVVKYRGDIFGGKLVGGVTNEQACLSDSTVTDDNTSVRVHRLAIALIG